MRKKRDKNILIPLIIIGVILFVISPFFPFLLALLIVLFAAYMIEKKKKTQIQPHQPRYFSETVSQQKKPPIPVVRKKDDFYERALEKLKRDSEVIPDRRHSIERFIRNTFGNSQITINRYLNVIDNAQKVLVANYEHAKSAIELFGSEKEATKERRELIEQYVRDSDEIVARFEDVVDELITMQTSKTIKEGDILDENLKNLAETTHLYSH